MRVQQHGASTFCIALPVTAALALPVTAAFAFAWGIAVSLPIALSITLADVHRAEHDQPV